MVAMGKSARAGMFEYLSTILREHAESLLLVFAFALLLRWLVISAFVVRSETMAPTLLEGELIIGYRPPFGLDLPLFGEVAKGRDPRPGELIIANCPTGLCLHRVVAVAGDRVEMQRQRLLINGTVCIYRPLQAVADSAAQLSESCPQFTGQIQIEDKWEPENYGPTMVPPGTVFVLNDNRMLSTDSRRWGPLKVEDVRAKATAIWLSLNWGASKGEPWFRPQRSFSRLN